MKKGALLVDNGYIGIRIPKLLLADEDIFTRFTEINSKLNKTGFVDLNVINELATLAREHVNFLIGEAILCTEEIEYLTSNSTDKLYSWLISESQEMKSLESLTDKQVLMLYAYNFLYAVSSVMGINKRNTIENASIRNQFSMMNLDQLRNLSNIINDIIESKTNEIEYDVLNKVNGCAIFGIRLSLKKDMLDALIKDPFYISEVSKLMEINEGYLITEQPNNMIFIPYKVLKFIHCVRNSSVVLRRFFTEIESRGFKYDYNK